MHLLHTVVLLPGLLIVAAMPGATAPQTPQAPLPDTPVGRRFAAWLDAFNRHDRPALRAFHAPESTADHAAERADREIQFCRETGGLAVDRVEESTETHLVLQTHTRQSEQWFRLVMDVEPTPPHTLKGLNLQTSPRPASAALKVRTEKEALRDLDAFIGRLVSADLFSGTVMISHNGKPIYTKVSGLASRAYHVPNRLDTKFNLGSMNKMFTAVAICQLAQAGKLSLDDPIGKHLTDYPNKDVARKVTIHHLLTHTSGMGSYFGPKFFDASRARFRTVQDYLPLIVDEPLAFEPGARWEYSNSGFMVLGAIVERVSGQSYFDYVREHIYRPAGMTNTDAYELDHETPNLATGYTWNDAEDENERRNNLFMHVIKGGPAGGGYSTVEDLTRFAEALQGHRLLNETYTALMTTGKVALPFDANAKYAYGIQDESVHGRRIVGHNGGFPGLNSQLDIYMDRGYTVAVMSNYDPPAASRIADRLRETLTRL